MAIPSITGGDVATTTNEYGGDALIAKGNNSLSNVGGFLGGAIDALTPKASEIFETRTATRIFNSHQDIALKNIEGSQFPTFNENQNLYGFTIFQFKKGLLGGGWSPATINSLLGFDLGGTASQMMGGDQIASVNSYFFNMHPKSINVTEPFATQLIPTQGGGIYAESQGAILRTLTLDGTTGYRPGHVHTPTAALDKVIPWVLDEPTGYLNFLKLRNVFRNYSDLKKTKSQAYKTYMVWFNNKEQEAWFFEPSTFTTSRDAASPFTYNYTISGTLVQKVNFSSVVNILHPDPKSPHFWISSMRRSASMINGIAGALMPALGDDVVGEVLGSLGSYLGMLDSLDKTVTNITDLGTGVVGLAPLVASVAVGAVQDVKDKWDNASKKYDLLMGGNISNSFDTLGKMLLFEHSLNDSIKSVINLVQPEVLAQIALEAPKEQTNSVVDPDDLAYSNTPDLTDDETEWVPKTYPGEMPIEQFVGMITGDQGAVDAVISYNGLTYPYISSTPTYQTGLNKFITAGDIIFIPVSKEIVSGDVNTKINLAKMSGSVAEEILGRDLKLVKKTHATTGVSEFNLSIDPNGDLEVVGGKKNMVQAIDIKLNTERGELSPHPEFGIVPVVGHKGTLNLNFNLYLSLNDTMLSDGRIKELVDTYVKVSGDTAFVKTKVNIINSLPSIPLQFSMGA